MTYSYAKLRQSLLLGLVPRFAECGFDFVKSRTSYVKKGDQVNLSYHLGFIRYPSEFNVTCHMAIRHNDVEDLVFKNTSEVSSDSAGIGVELGNYIFGQPKRWGVSTSNDVGIVSNSIFDSFQCVAVPFFEKYSQVDEALRVYSGDGSDSMKLTLVNDARARRAIGMAFSLKRKELFFKLSEEKEEFLRRVEDPMIGRYLNFRNFLNEMIRERGETW